MSTVAYRNGVLAADSRLSFGDTISPSGGRKIFDLGDGRLLGFVGSFASAHALLRHFTQPEMFSYPELAEASAILILPDGSGMFYDDNGFYPISLEPYFAIGSGQDAALGAMAVGASAKRAVEAAISVDKHSGGQIQVLRLRKGS